MLVPYSDPLKRAPDLQRLDTLLDARLAFCVRLGVVMSHSSILTLTTLPLAFCITFRLFDLSHNVFLSIIN